jgi:hypothetical protein
VQHSGTAAWQLLLLHRRDVLPAFHEVTGCRETGESGPYHNNGVIGPRLP